MDSEEKLKVMRDLMNSPDVQKFVKESYEEKYGKDSNDTTDEEGIKEK